MIIKVLKGWKEKMFLKGEPCTGTLPRKGKDPSRISMSASFFVFFYKDDDDVSTSYVMLWKGCCTSMTGICDAKLMLWCQMMYHVMLWDVKKVSNVMLITHNIHMRWLGTRPGMTKWLKVCLRLMGMDRERMYTAPPDHRYWGYVA